MKGYKGMNSDMTCRGMQYEVGKSYHQKGKIALCKNGFHFCKDLRSVFKFYQLEDNSRYFEVEATGNIRLGDDKCCTSDLTVIRELTDIEVNRSYYGNDYDYDYDYGNGCGNGNNIQKVLIFKEV